MGRVKKHPEGAAEHAAAIQHWEPAPRLYKGPLCAAVVQLSRFVMRGLNSVDFDDFFLAQVLAQVNCSSGPCTSSSRTLDAQALTLDICFTSVLVVIIVT